jgi:hypothetical protein
MVSAAQYSCLQGSSGAVQWRYSGGTVALNGTECSAVQRSEMQCSYGVHSAVQ